MASFVEQATLKVVDKSSAQIRRINAELKKLATTARSLKSTSVDIRVNTGNVVRAASQLAKLQGQLRSLRGSASTSIRVNTSDIARATRDLRALHALARRPIRVSSGGGGIGIGGGGGGGGSGRRSPTQPRANRTYAGAFAQGAVQGAGVPNFGAFYRATASLAALTAAGYGAAKALRSISEAGYERSRTRLQTKALSSPEQQRFAATLPPSWKGAPLPWTSNEFEKMVSGLRGDVGGEGAETERRARVLAKYAQDVLYPRIYAQSGKSPAESQEGLREIFKGINISTAAIFDEKTGELTADFDRVVQGVALAQAANTEIKPGLLKTILAGSKTAGFTLDANAIAGMLIQGGDFGQRVGNETFRLIRSLFGGIDNKKLNKSLEAAGLLVKGKPVDADLLSRSPGEFLQKYLAPNMRKDLEAPGSASAKRIDAARRAGKTEGEIDAMMQRDRVNYLAKLLPNMPQTALNQLNQLILGWEQAQRARQQATVALDQPVPKLLLEEPSAQWDKLKTALSDTAGNLGDFAAQVTNAAGTFSSFTKLLRGETLTPDEKGIIATTGAIGAGGLLLLLKTLGRGMPGAVLGGAAGAAAGAAGVPANVALNTSAGLLSGAAVQLSAAAVALGGRGLIPGAAAAAAGGTATAAATGVTAATIARTVLFSAIRLGGPLGILLASTVPAGGKSQHKELEAINANREQLAKVAKEVAVAEEKRAALMKAQDTASPQKFAELAREIAALDATLEGLKSVVDAAAARVKADWERSQPSARPTPGFIEDSENALRKQKYPLKPWPTDAIPMPDWLPQLKTAGDTIAAGGVPLLGAASTLSSIPTAFDTTFSTGAQAIGNAGTTAADALWGRAPEIGQLIGTNASQAISSAINNLSINVNANVKGADTGSQKEAN